MIATQCQRCGKEFEAYPSTLKAGKGKFCSRTCASTAWWDEKGRPGTKHTTVIKPGHPLQTNQRGAIPTHRVVLYDKIGPGPHACHWCGTRVEWMLKQSTKPGNLIPDHLNGNPRDNRPENLVPSCHRCNCRRGMTDLVGDDEVYIVRRDGRARAERRACEYCGTEFLHPKGDKKPNKGRFCSMSCARRKPRARTTLA